MILSVQYASLPFAPSCSIACFLLHSLLFPCPLVLSLALSCSLHPFISFHRCLTVTLHALYDLTACPFPDHLVQRLLRRYVLPCCSPKVPTEVTTMAGRRMRDQLKATLVAQGIVGPDAMVVIAGLANGYADYTTTYEEYVINFPRLLR